MSEQTTDMSLKTVQEVVEAELTPQEYFDYVKGRKQTISESELDGIYDNCLQLINKYVITGQTPAIKKLLFHMDCIEKEKELIKLGVDTFVYRDVIEDYIDNVAKDTVKVTELRNYERDIPDEIVEVVEKVKPIFDEIYIVFTDYTGKIEKQVEKERRSKDPILFGCFKNSSNRSIVDRFYYLGDWIDEYCELTLDKMVHEYKATKKQSPIRKISTPQDIDELRQQLKDIELNRNRIVLQEPTSIPVSSNTAGDSKKPKLFSAIRTIFTGKKE